MTIFSVGRMVTLGFSFSLPEHSKHASIAPITTSTIRTDRTSLFRRHSHSTMQTTTPAPLTPTPTLPMKDEDVLAPNPSTSGADNECSSSLSTLVSLLNATSSDLLRLETSQNNGVRGVYLNRPVAQDDIILRLPLDLCLQDDDPPQWYEQYQAKQDELASSVELEETTTMQGSDDWASRLAASLLDLQLKEKAKASDTATTSTGTVTSNIDEARALWLSMLPDSIFLRSSLPIHWDEEILESARSTALELAIDTAYFTRAEAIQNVVDAARQHFDLAQPIHISTNELTTMCENALDIIQTRSCRPERRDHSQWGTPVRLLAPVFDFINHGGGASANAYFDLEGGEVTDLTAPALVVRASRTGGIASNEQVTIDYGESARPAWKCLASYGFVPEYKHSNNDEDDDDANNDNVAEIYMDGARYEVGPSTVPFDLVEAVSASLGKTENENNSICSDLKTLDNMLDSLHCNDGEPLEEGKEEKYEQLQQQTEVIAENMLTPEVALCIAKRVSDVGFQLLLNPEDEDANSNRSPEELHSAKLAASLRWAQHRILLNCAVGLRDYATAHQD